jgi:hypothetical protein
MYGAMPSFAVSGAIQLLTKVQVMITAGICYVEAQWLQLLIDLARAMQLVITGA